MQQKNFPASQLESLRTTCVDDLQKGKTTGHEEENSRCAVVFFICSVYFNEIEYIVHLLINQIL